MKRVLENAGRGVVEEARGGRNRALHFCCRIEEEAAEEEKPLVGEW